MRLRTQLDPIFWLVRDTFRQALASRIFWLTLGMSGVIILLCLSIRLEGPRTLRPDEEIELYGGDEKPLTGPNPRPGRLTLAFGAFPIYLFRGVEAEMHFLHVLLAKWAAGAAGTLLALIWTAGFLPEFLQPNAISVLLAKPIPRWSLLLGKYLGVIIFVAFQTIFFIGGTWLALGARTGIWLPAYLWSIPLLLLHFAVIYSFSAMLATYTRSTVTCVFGSIVAWLVCFATNYGRHALVGLSTLAPGSAPLPSRFRWIVETCYWILPKPADLVLILDHVLDADAHFSSMVELQAAQQMHAFHPVLSVLTSLLFTCAMMAVAARQLNTTDY
jgi:ABC-type transport system involved in multi-copper enzyme maturation permease subunit